MVVDPAAKRLTVTQKMRVVKSAGEQGAQLPPVRAVVELAEEPGASEPELAPAEYSNDMSDKFADVGTMIGDKTREICDYTAIFWHLKYFGR